VSRPVALCLILSACAVTASAVQEREAAGGLAVEIVYRDDRAPTYIPGNETVWFSRFRRIPAWRSPADSLPVRAVQVASTVESPTTVRLTVSVRLGVEFHDEVKSIASYLARADEKIVVEELKQFGIVPVELRVVRAHPLGPVVPYVENQTQALELLDIAALDVSFPSYRVRLRNLSGRGIAALGVYFFNEKGACGGQWLFQPQNQTLVDAGAIYELNAFGGNSGRLRDGGYAPDGLKRVTIHTVVFTDGTYEGEAQTAAHINALWRGRKAQLGRALPLVRESLAAADVDEPGAVSRFRARVPLPRCGRKEECGRRRPVRAP
jgi:hypothetical protein